ncbi:MAG: YbjN domain-containing protein, partial [Rhodopirellula sp. JB053]
MSALVDQLSAYLDRGTIVYEQDAERGLFRMLFEGKHGDIRVMMLIDESMLQVFTHPANKIPESHRQLIAEAITRANYG